MAVDFTRSLMCLTKAPAVAIHTGENMTRVEKLEKAVQDLSQRELATFRRWFERFDAAAWDRQFEEDVKSGVLDRLAEQAASDHEAGKSKEL